MMSLFSVHSHKLLYSQCTTRINFREAMQSTRKILAGAAGLTTAFVAGGFAKDKFNQVNI